MKGASASRARRREISVLPTPVGPISRILLGRISSRISSSAFMRRQRLRSAIATERFASFCPIIYLSSSSTTCRGVKFCCLISWFWFIKLTQFLKNSGYDSYKCKYQQQCSVIFQQFLLQKV